ncbi:MAG: ImmA/IrrE family metallo-endopeptidase [Deltaproteobacteria bacterium]|nr:ImmA/IrrE family metallo-endopeptidase [Deltaproteobacteria bacterium]
MRYVRDTSGRFAQRPHYKPEELEAEADGLVRRYLARKYGSASFPISTDDLSTLIEQFVDHLDIYADLSHYGPEVEGVTEFFVGRKPNVKIARPLGEDSRLTNRLRATLAHELGHVHLHGFLFATDDRQGGLFSESAKAEEKVIVCKREQIAAAKEYDWMEWQAWFFSGAILMPQDEVIAEVRNFRQERGVSSDIVAASPQAQELAGAIATRFEISNDFAKVRLIRLNLLTTSGSASLF